VHLYWPGRVGQPAHKSEHKFHGGLKLPGVLRTVDHTEVRRTKDDTALRLALSSYGLLGGTLSAERLPLLQFCSDPQSRCICNGYGWFW